MYVYLVIYMEDSVVGVFESEDKAQTYIESILGDDDHHVEKWKVE